MYVVAGGRLIERLVRTYDSAGRPVETKAVVEDISAMFPADFAKELLNQPGAEEELQRQLSELRTSTGIWQNYLHL